MVRVLTLILVTFAAFIPSVSATVRDAASLSALLMSSHDKTGILDQFDLEARLSNIIVCGHDFLFLTVEDATGATLLKIKEECTPVSLSAGDVIHVEGNIHNKRSSYARAEVSTLKVLRHEQTHTPPEATAEQFFSGEIDWRRVTIRGFVRDVLPSETNGNWMFLVLVSNGHVIYLSYPLNEEDPSAGDALVGTDVTAEGYCSPQDTSPRHYQGRIFQCSGLSAIHPISSVRPDPFLAPPLESVRYLGPEKIALLGYRRDFGHVLAIWGERDALIQTRNGDVVQLSYTPGTTPKRGDFIEVAGIPLSNFFHITLTHAIWRKTQPWAAPVADSKPLPTLPLDARNRLGRRLADLHGKSVMFTGSVRNLPDETLSPGILQVETKEAVVPVDMNAIPSILNKLREKSEVSVTGICIIETENWRPDLLFPRIKGIKLIVQDIHDVVILADPPWWTTKRLLAIIGTLLAVLLGVSVWNRSLNRLAELRGRNLLREEMRHARADLKTEERTRLAVELHDSLAQNLTGVSMEIETAQRCANCNVREMNHHLDIAGKALKSCRHELRNTLWDLRNSALEEHNMDRAIQRTLIPHIGNVKLTVRFNAARHYFSETTAHDILRIVRELTLNGIRHGGATEIRIAGSLEADTLIFSVVDNGCGFDTWSCPGVSEGHFGLQGIRERLRKHSGTLTFEKTHGTGMRAVVTLKLSTPDV